MLSYNLCKKARKVPGKSELKAFVDQFEEKLAKAHQKCVEDQQATQNAQNEKGKKYTAGLNVDSILEMEAATRALEAMNLTPATPHKPVKKERAKKVKAPPRRKRHIDSDDEDENDAASPLENSDEDMLQENDQDSIVAPASARPRRNKLLQNVNETTPRAGSRVSSRKGTPAKAMRTATR